MWRPVALSAFLALLFMTARSGQPPIQTDGEAPAKGDLGAEALNSGKSAPPIKIDLARSSVHEKDGVAAKSDAGRADSAASARRVAETDEKGVKPEIQIADLSVQGKQTIPLPAPKTGDATTTDVRVVVTEGEQKTALSSGEEEGLSLMPPGPDFAATVQRELARLGCYPGRVDNIWGPMSRNAVARFNRAANAKLPLKQPTRALLSSARKAPDRFCAGGAVAGESRPKVAALEPGGGVEALKKRPSYLPPWMRGEPMPEPDENRVARQPEPEAKPEQPATRTAAREEPRTTRTSASRAEAQRRARTQRRVRNRLQPSLRQVLRSSNFSWPGN